MFISHQNTISILFWSNFKYHNRTSIYDIGISEWYEPKYTSFLMVVNQLLIVPTFRS